MYYKFKDDEEAWLGCHDEDRWVFNKLEVSRRLGYDCGPSPLPVRTPGEYIIRPCVNMCGMGLGAEIVFIENETAHLPPGTFWCEVFSGRHLSIDYMLGEQILCVEGFRREDQPLSRFSAWEIVDDIVPFPEILTRLKGSYHFINVEMIGGRIIEIHLRNNPDFEHGARKLTPVWIDEHEKVSDPNFISDPWGDRLGFIRSI